MAQEPIDPKDVAAGTAVGAGSRYGVARFKRRRRGEAAGVGAGTALPPSKRSDARSLWVTAVAVVIVLAGMLFVMLRFAQ
jgi:hypothetical protein